MEVIAQMPKSNLEEKLKYEWQNKWTLFGDYRIAKRNRRSKFYSTLAKEISNASSETISRDTIQRFDQSTRGDSKNMLEIISAYFGNISLKQF